MELNRVFLAGRLTQDAALKYTPNGAPVCTLRLASNHRWYAKETNEKKEETLYMNITLFGKQAESAAQLKKGKAVLTEGRLKQEEWTNKEGKKQTSYSIVADKWQYSEARPEGYEADEPARAAPPKQQVLPERGSGSYDVLF